MVFKDYAGPVHSFLYIKCNTRCHGNLRYVHKLKLICRRIYCILYFVFFVICYSLPLDLKKERNCI